MIEIASNAKTVSRLCERSIGMEYFEMLVQKKKLENDVIKTMEYLSKHPSTCETSDLFVQFPNHETMLTSIKSCSYIVRGKKKNYKFHYE